MKRTLTPEILDSLPPEDSSTRHSRRDLRIFNAVLGGTRWLRRTVPACVRSDERVIEIGAGTGDLAASLTRRGFITDGLDLAPRPAAWPENARWHQADALGFAGWRDYDAMIGNLIFHHFDADALRTLGGKMSRHARIIIACEPARRRIFQRLFAVLCTLVGANDVSRHDGRVSIEAGFLHDELPAMLGLDPACWHWKVTTTLRGMYRMVASRRA
jgi:SAM-dependent methyltransferase